ncbi:MAG: transposase [Desulfohalobiaceae bacterium]|nr:transposase [Desulfohalobiaceae bacterium]
MAREASKHIAEWKFQRFIRAKYWNVRVILWWSAEQVLSTLPPPRDCVLYLIADGSTKDKRGEHGPVNQKGKTSKHKGYFFGFKFVVLMAAWDGYRIPVDFALILPKDHKDYKKENKLFRDMLDRFTQRVPAWAKTVIVIGDSAYASKENLKHINKLRKEKYRNIKWGYVMALAKSWNIGNGKKLKDLAKHTPRKYFQQTSVPPLTKSRCRRTFYLFEKRTVLEHLGDVTVVLSRKRRNSSPSKTKALVTNLTELTARQVLSIYKRRWPIEILFKELKSGLGLGQHQVTKDKDRVDKSVGVAIIAYLTLIRARHHEIKPGQAWSIFQLKNSFTWEVYHQQIEHTFKLKLNKYAKAA